MEPAVFLLLLLALAALFWGYAPLRGSERKLAAACRTAPPGCLLAVGGMIALVYAGKGLGNRMLPLLPLTALLILAVFPLILNFLQKILRVASGRNPALVYWIAAAVLAGFFVFILAWSEIREFRSFDPAGQPWRTVRMTGKAAGVDFEFRPIHPFLAEYEYRVMLPAEALLITNTGGSMRLNVWIIADSGGKTEALMFSGRHGDTLVDFGTATGYALRRASGRVSGAPLRRDGHGLIQADSTAGVDFTARKLYERRRPAGRIVSGQWLPGEPMLTEPDGIATP